MNQLDIMDGLYSKFDSILASKMQELERLASAKRGNKKVISNNGDGLKYGEKNTLAKIHAEQERKLKSSKAYKKMQEAE